MRILIADPLAASAVDVLQREPGWTVDTESGRTPETLAAALAGADALIVRSATRADATLIAAAPGLRVIARAGTGVDNVDLDAASARGILVVNAPGANSVSVAEHACALMLALARSVTSADRAMKDQRWDKKRLLGAELRGKTLGLVGLGRVGQEVASRSAAFGMTVVAHDPFIAASVAEAHGVELVPLDDLCRRSDYISLHVPVTPATRRLFDASRLALCKPGVRLINTARGELVDEEALAEAIERGHVGGAGLDVFEVEPPERWRLAALPQVVATPHIAASTLEAQEQVGLETALTVRDFLKHGAVRNAINFPAVAADELARLQPYLLLASRLGRLLAQAADGRFERIGIGYYGQLAGERSELLSASALLGILQTILSAGVTIVNARALATARGLEVTESRSSRPRDYTSVLALSLRTSTGELRAEGTVFGQASPRLVLFQNVAVEAPLEGAVLLIQNRDQPGVIGDVGTVLGRHGINIANFALGRAAGGAVGVVNIDETGGPNLEPARLEETEASMLREIRALSAITWARLVRLAT
jgi:D-3-phosphoglycerate dehydrogenase